MCSRGARPGNGDMGQGSEIMQGKALPVEPLAELAITHARFHGDRLIFSIQRQDLIEMLERAMSRL